MARTYAGVLGSLAFLVCLARGIVHGAPAVSVLGTACGHLLVFAAIGYVLGWMARGIVDDAVRGRLAAELAAEQSAESASAETSAGR